MENYDIVLNENVFSLNENLEILNENPQKIKKDTIIKIKEVISSSNKPYTIKDAINEFVEYPESFNKNPKASKLLYEDLMDVSKSHKNLSKKFEKDFREKKYDRIISYISSVSLDDFDVYKDVHKAKGIMLGGLGGFIASRIIKKFVNSTKAGKGEKLAVNIVQTTGSISAGSKLGGYIADKGSKRKFDNDRKVLEDEEIIKLLPSFIKAFKIMGNKYENVAKQLKSKYSIKHESFLLENNIFW